MADEKAKKKNPLYDRDDEKKQSMRDREDESAGTAKADMKKDDKSDNKDMAPVNSSSDKFLEAMKNLHKTHEGERRDFHGNQRDALRQMQGRHEKSFKDLMEGFTADQQPEITDQGTPGAISAISGDEAEE